MRHRIRIDELPAAGLSVVLEDDPALRDALVDALDGEGDPRCRAELTVQRKDRRVEIDGSMSLAVRLACARCLADVPVARDTGIRAVLVLEAPDADDGVELDDEELDESYLEGDEIDLVELVREQVLLAMPDKPLCSEDCKGLCPSCGADLNAGPCSCEPEVGDPRLAVLANLQLDDES